ncbi:helix-turn-helix domain-containing protein [Reyranella sp.]|uniref:helix-turn-helix domain-containing protein n=1 Tax=Reyranella sp. TaxID=1929291 RepID=UPI003BA87CBF
MIHRSVLPIDDRPPAPDLGRATRFIDDHLDDALSVATVAAVAGVAGRTLHKRFLDRHGTTPMRYVRDCRLARARAALLCAGPQDSVTSIALHCGFRHLGRFAVAYRRRYGETPSQTLRRDHA